MGGLKKFMPITFATYAVGMLALSGFPLVFSGFWSKDAILHSAHAWSVSQIPFYLGCFGALLTAFYMTRQVALVFFGPARRSRPVLRSSTAEGGREEALSSSDHHAAKKSESPHVDSYGEKGEPHESPRTMTWPLIILAVCTIALSAIGTPAWPWFQKFLGAHNESNEGVVLLMVLSSVIVFAGLGLGWFVYGRKPVESADAPDPLEKLPAGSYSWLQKKFGIDELYEISIIRFNAWASKACDFLDQVIWSGGVRLVSMLTIVLSHVNSAFDRYVINLGFDETCSRVTFGGRLMSRLQDGRVQNYLRVIGLALAALVLLLLWGCHGP
jgi:NADH-quinone oxidoreductase subunit L